MLIRILPVWRFVHGAPNALRSPVQESPTKIIQGGRVTGPATWPYSRHIGRVVEVGDRSAWLDAGSRTFGLDWYDLNSRLLEKAS